MPYGFGFYWSSSQEIQFEAKFASLLSNSRKSVDGEIRTGFSSVPRGCYIHLEKIAQQYVLENIQSSFGNQNALISRIATFEEDSGKELSLSSFLGHYHLDAKAMYRNRNFSRLCVLAGKQENFSELLEEDFTRAFGRICAIDSRRLIKFIINMLDDIDSIDMDLMDREEMIMLQMFLITIWPKLTGQFSAQAIREKLKFMRNCPTMLNEMKALLQINFEKIDLVDERIADDFPFPLDLHCTYTRDQLFVGLGYQNPVAVREGVKWLPEIECDVFTVTLNKSAKDYSPSTMYQDYSINETLFHWQSQSTTTPESTTGQRYQKHGMKGYRMLLFVREFRRDSYRSTEPYTFLGQANYVSHEGSRPMSIIYELERPIPAKYLKKTNKLLVG